MTTNLSILQQNTCLGLSENGQDIYLRGCGRNETKALLVASEWDDKIEPVLQAAFSQCARIHVEQGRDAESANNAVPVVIRFMRERHFRRYFPDGRDI